MTTETQSSTNPQSVKADASDESDLTTTDAPKTSHDIPAKETPSKPDNPEPKQSTTTTILVIVSVLLSVFLVGLDRTIISTV